MTNCTLLIPGLLPPPQWQQAGALRDLRLPALETLLARSQRQAQAAVGMEAWLGSAFGIARQRDWPVAPLTLLAAGGEPKSDYWLQAEPVHIQLQRDRLVLIDAQHLALSAEEAASLTASLNQHFADDGLFLTATRPGSWHLRLAKPPEIDTRPLAEVVGRDIRHFLPGGPEGQRWHGILNEIQMLLYTHQVNQAREQRGALTVNSVWPWGGGTLPASAASAYSHVWSNEPLTAGLARLAGIPAKAAPASADQWLKEAEPGNHLIVLDALRSAALSGDYPRWCEALNGLESGWFRLLLQALAAGPLGRLELLAFNGETVRSVRACRADLWKFWRLKKPLTDFFGEQT
jgi:hypothetical protein